MAASSAAATQDETRAASLRAKGLAAKLGKPIKTYCHVTVITAAPTRKPKPGRKNIATGWTRARCWACWKAMASVGNAMTARAQGAFMTQTVIGAPDTCAAQIEQFLRDCDIDGLMFIYDDYPSGLRVTGREILPRLRKAFP